MSELPDFTDFTAAPAWMDALAPSLDLEAIKARSEAATEGPWEWDNPTIGQHWSRPEPWATVVDDEVNCGGYCYGGSSSPIKSDADGRFIAHAREDIPALVAEIERLLRLLHTEADARRPEPTPEPKTREDHQS